MTNTKLSLNPDSHKNPRGGHHFSDHGVKFEAENFQTLARKVERYRTANNIPAGDPEQEILRYYETLNPALVLRHDEKIEEKPEDMRLWEASVRSLWRNPPAIDKTPQVHAAARQMICGSCPFNVKITEFKKFKEFPELERRAFVLRNGTGLAANVGYCRLHRVDIGILSFTENPKSNPSAGTKPESCWFK